MDFSVKGCIVVSMQSVLVCDSFVLLCIMWSVWMIFEVGEGGFIRSNYVDVSFLFN